MAAKKAKTETPGSSASEVRAKSAVVGTDLQPKVARSDPLYEAITQQIAYIISATTNQNLTKNHECHDSKQSIGNGKISNTKFQGPKKGRKDMKCRGCGVLDMVGESAPHSGKVTISLSDQPTRI